MNMINEFMKFKNSFRGDPKKQVMDLVNSGRMTQDQLNRLQVMAGQFQNMMKMMK